MLHIRLSGFLLLIFLASSTLSPSSYLPMVFVAAPTRSGHSSVRIFCIVPFLCTVDSSGRPVCSATYFVSKPPEAAAPSDLSRQVILQPASWELLSAVVNIIYTDDTQGASLRSNLFVPESCSGSDIRSVVLVLMPIESFSGLCPLIQDPKQWQNSRIFLLTQSVPVATQFAASSRWEPPSPLNSWFSSFQGKFFVNGCPTVSLLVVVQIMGFAGAVRIAALRPDQLAEFSLVPWPPAAMIVPSSELVVSSAVAVTGGAAAQARARAATKPPVEPCVPHRCPASSTPEPAPEGASIGLNALALELQQSVLGIQEAQERYVTLRACSSVDTAVLETARQLLCRTSIALSNLLTSKTQGAIAASLWAAAQAKFAEATAVLARG